MPVISGRVLQSFDQEDLTVDATVGGVRFDLAKLLATPHAKAATCKVETAQIRWKKDASGTVTATTGGYIANPNEVFYLDSSADLLNFRAIRTGSTSGKVHVEYHR